MSETSLDRAFSGLERAQAVQASVDAVYDFMRRAYLEVPIPSVLEEPLANPTVSSSCGLCPCYANQAAPQVEPASLRMLTLPLTESDPCLERTEKKIGEES